MKSFFIPVDFIILDMKEDMHLCIILDKSFLTTAETLIDVQEVKLTFRVNGEELAFNFNES